VTVLWSPPDDVRETTEIGRYLTWLGRDFASYDELWRWSVEEPEAFWASIWDFFAIRGGYDRVLSGAMPDARWFEGARLNYVEHLLGGEGVAVVARSQTRGEIELTFAQLRDQVARVRAGLLRLGVKPGDRVAGYLPNIPETLVAFAATASIGAIWASCAPELGPRSVIDRLGQLSPKVLLAVSGYGYRDRMVDRREEVAAVRAGIEHVVDVPYGEHALPDAITWEELAADEAPLEYAQLPFDHPLWVLYSSGTTGLPKAIVHGQGGILLEHLKKLRLHLDARAGDRLFWFTTTGWMMWNFLVGGLLSESSIVLFDGNPAHPDLGTLWDLADAAGITSFGTSAGYIASCQKAGVEPRAGRDLSRLDSVGSTGSPLAPEGFDWVRDRLGKEVWLFSTSGGTDVCTAFVGGVPTLPVYRGELQARALGAKVEAWSEDGRPLVGEVGELVITEPMPSMPLYLWGDDDGSRYRESYFSTFPGVWRHGDWIEITERGTAIITGRSDATINRGGVRMGTSELYRSVLALDEVLDALVVDVPDGEGSRMTLFVVLRQGAALDDRLEAEIRRRIREDCSPRHVPDAVLAAPEIPRTLSGKILEVPVKRLLMGAPADEVASRDSLANPEALDWFAGLTAGSG